MKIEALRKIIREEVKSAIQEELKDILLEAVRSNKQPIQESKPTPVAQPQSPPPSKSQIRESYQNILGETATTFNTSQINQPLQITSTDTASPNGKLPDGEVSMDQIMGIMNNR